MKYDLRHTREILELSLEDVSKYIGIGTTYCERYELLGELPSKYVYLLWKRVPGVPIPEDFFYYTSYTLKVNMDYHGLKQVDIRDRFHLQNQSIVSKYLAENIPLYEMKEYFVENFSPFIVPFEMRYRDGGMDYYPITELVPRYNVTENFRKMAIRRGQKVKETNEKKRLEKQLEEKNKEN